MGHCLISETEKIMDCSFYLYIKLCEFLSSVVYFGKGDLVCNFGHLPLDVLLTFVLYVSYKKWYREKDLNLCRIACEPSTPVSTK